MLPATTAAQAVAVIDRLRLALHSQPLSSMKIAVTFSAGIAEYSGGDRRKLLAKADKALYAAKMPVATDRSPAKVQMVQCRMVIDQPAIKASFPVWSPRQALERRCYARRWR